MSALDVHQIRSRSSNTYLVPNGRRSLLVDSGPPGSQGRILDAVQKTGLKPGDIALIVLTHTHYDHAGSLAALKSATGAAVIVHSREREYLIRGCTPMPAATRLWSRPLSFVGKLLAARLGCYPPVEPDWVVEDQLDLSEHGLPGFILHTPGHTPGSVAVVLEDRVAFTGDNLTGTFPRTAFPPFADNVEQLLKSWELLLATGCETFYPGHGRPVSRELLQRSLAGQVLRRTALPS